MTTSSPEPNREEVEMHYAHVDEKRKLLTIKQIYLQMETLGKAERRKRNEGCKICLIGNS